MPQRSVIRVSAGAFTHWYVRELCSATVLPHASVRNVLHASAVQPLSRSGTVLTTLACPTALFRALAVCARAVSYFNLKARGEPTRLALVIGKVPFEDWRLPAFDQWPAMKPTTRWGQLPELTVGEGDSELVFAQGDAMLRYAGKLTGLYPTDDLEALRVDEFLGAVEDVRMQIVPSVREKDAEKKAAMRKALDEETLPMWLGKFDGFIGTNGGTYLAKSGGKPALTIADLGLYALMSWLTGGVLDGVSTDWSRFANITAMCAAISAIPEVAEFEAAK